MDDEEQQLRRTEKLWEDPKVKRLVAQAIESARGTDPRVFPVICNIIKELNVDIDTARALLLLALKDKAWIEKYKKSYDTIFGWIDSDNYSWPVKQMGGVSIKSAIRKIKIEQRRKRVNELLRDSEAKHKVAMEIESVRTDSLSCFNAHTPLEQAPCRVLVTLENISRALNIDMATVEKISTTNAAVKAFIKSFPKTCLRWLW
ncbi:hypothetical protein GH141_03405 [bacterium]|nr:hypothetical protein [bacterium]